MLTGFVLPGGPATKQVEQAVLAEQSGWDGVFVPELAYGVDAWSLLAAMAARTERIRLGTLLTPLPWRRPWKVASQVATVDQLSGGRAILAVGVGAVDTGLPSTGEETDKRLRATRMDEGIDLIRTLWDGGLSYHGEFYDFECDGDGLIRAVRPASGEGAELARAGTQWNEKTYRDGEQEWTNSMCLPDSLTRIASANTIVLTS